MNTFSMAHLRRRLLIRCIFLTAIVVTPTAKRLTTQADVTSQPQAVTNSLAIKPIFDKLPTTVPTLEASSHNPYSHSSTREQNDSISSDNVPDDVITTSSFPAPEETTISSFRFDLSMAVTTTSTEEGTTTSTEEGTTTSTEEGTTTSTEEGTTTSTEEGTTTSTEEGTTTSTEEGTTTSTEEGTTTSTEEGTTTSTEEGTTTSTEEGTTTSTEEGTTTSTEEGKTTSTEEGTTTSTEEGTTTSTEEGTTTSTEEGTTTSTEEGTATSTEEGTTTSTEEGTTTSTEEETTKSTEERTTISEVEEITISTKIGTISSTGDKRTPTFKGDSTTTSIEHSGSNNHSISPEGTTTSVDDGTKTSTENGTKASTKDGTETSTEDGTKTSTEDGTETSTEEETTSTQSDAIRTTPTPESFLSEPGFVSVETVKTSKTIILSSSIVISFVGILLNVPSLVVFRRMSASVNNSYIQLLLFLDTVCLVFNVPMVIVEIFYKDVFYLPLYYAYFKIYCAMLVVIATRNVLIILTALMTLNRTLAVMFSMKKSQCCSWLSFSKTIAGVVMLLSLAVTCTDGALRLRIEEYVDEVSGNVYGVIRPTALFANYMKEFMQVYLGFNTLFQYWAIVLTILCNIALLVSLIRHDHFMQQAGVDTTNVSVLRRSNTFRSVKVVLLYSFFVTLLALPVTLLHIIDIARPDLRKAQGNLHGIFEHLLLFLDVISSGADFFVFFAINSAFRADFRSLVRKGLCGRGGATTESMTGP